MTAYRQADIGHIPFPGHRTQLQVRLDEEANAERRAKYHHKLGREMTSKQRRSDAARGSAALGAAIRRAAR